MVDTDLEKFLVTSLIGAVTKLREATISYVMSVRPSVHLPAWNNWPHNEPIFMKFDI
jgi:hypothetical protein